MALATCADRISGKGTSFLVGDAAPATADKAGYEAVTYTKLGLLNSISGGIGPEASVNTFEVLDADAVCKSLGAIDYGEMTVTVGLSQADDGLLAVRPLVGVNENIAFEMMTSKKGAAGIDMLPFSVFLTGKIRSCRVNPADINGTITCDIGIVLEGGLFYRDAVDGT